MRQVQRVGCRYCCEGVAWLPRSSVVDELARGDLATTGGPEWRLELEIRVYRDATRRNTLVSTLWEELRATSGEAGK